MSREALIMLAEAYGMHVRDGTVPSALQVRQTAELLTLILPTAPVSQASASHIAADQRLHDLAALLPPADAPASQPCEWLVSVFAAGWANDGDLYVAPDELPTLVLALRAIANRIRALERQLGIQAPPPRPDRPARGNVVLLAPPMRSLAHAFGHLAGLTPAEPPPLNPSPTGGLVA